MATLELPYEKVYDLLHKCCTSISPDVLYLMKRAVAKETNPEAKTFLETMLKNVELAGQTCKSSKDHSKPRNEVDTSLKSPV